MSTTRAAHLVSLSLCGVLALTGHAAAGTQGADAALADWEAHGRGDGLARPDTQCQDFLLALGRKPATIEYLGCEQDDASYLQPMTARYRVSGASAVAVEAYLHQTFGMPMLTYACCGWSSGAPYAWRAGPDAVGYDIGMGVETVRYPREQWARIPGFEIRVGVVRRSP
ncbi:DUF4952 domain-containing protein [Stenotrophomonas sp. BIGb0135]|uniref:DUF4952 domain-containing protein n=1 Tax=Stenotrophomonas sp. BIGb0135 TaxID=2940620 RepID=UPI0021677EBA|nr:DUF4952 domain-containing protein [Stenotrophomonas sp. BIGb0135]MCS4233497.1 hypothetical protein [Stenotrophomonas sp. BIGb0135]